MASVIDILIKANTQQAVGGMKNFSKSIDEVTRGLTGFSLSGLGVTAAVVGIGNELKKAVTEYNKYALAMGDAAQLSGITAEEMSRLTQAADDARVSQEALTAAFGIALKNGFVPTIENIANLSDELLAMEDPAQRAEKASEIFGRGWKDIQKFLLQGGDAIRENTAAIADGLIVTDEAVEKNKQLALEIDNLGDSWTAVKNTLAAEVVPGMADSLSIFNRNITALQEGVPLWDVLVQNQKDYAAAEAIASREADIANKSFSDVGATVAMMTTTTQEATAALDGITAATYSATDVMKSYNDQLLFTIASEGFTADEAMNLALQMGLVSSETRTAYEKTSEWKQQLDDGKITLDEYKEKVLGLQSAIAGLQDRTVTITVNTVGNTGLLANQMPSGYTDYDGRAAGGPVQGGQPYVVGEQGPEMFVPSSSGNIVPNNQLGGVTVNIYQQPGESGEQLANRVLGKMSRLSSASGIRAAGG